MTSKKIKSADNINNDFNGTCEKGLRALSHCAFNCLHVFSGGSEVSIVHVHTARHRNQMIEKGSIEFCGCVDPEHRQPFTDIRYCDLVLTNQYRCRFLSLFQFR